MNDTTKGLAKMIGISAAAGAVAGIVYPLAKKKSTQTIVAWGIGGAIVGVGVWFAIVAYQESHQ